MSEPTPAKPTPALWPTAAQAIAAGQSPVIPGPAAPSDSSDPAVGDVGSEEHLTAEKARIEQVLIRHHFVVVGDGDLGFCAGPYCAGGIVSRDQHAAHVADALLNPPGSQMGGDPDA